MSETKKFSSKEALGFAWQAFKAQWKFLVLVLIAVLALSVLFNLIQTAVISSLFWATLVMLVGWVIQIFIRLAWTTITLRIADGGTAGWHDLTKNTQLIWKFFGATILYGIVVTIGMIFLIVPGVYIAIRWFFWPYVLIDKPELGIAEVFAQASEVSAGVRWDIFVLFFVFLGVLILGVLALFVGIIPAFFVIGIATAYIYRKLLTQTSTQTTE